MAIEGTEATPTATPTPPVAPAPKDPIARAMAALQTPSAPAPEATATPATPEPPKPAEEVKPTAGEEAKRFAALTRKESAIRKQQQEIKTAQEQLAKERTEIEHYRRERDNAKRNPEAIAKALWGDNWYGALTEYRLNQNTPTPELIAASVDEKLDAFEKKIEQGRTQQLEQEKQQIVAQQQQEIERFRGETIEYVKTNGNLYEMTVAYGAEQYVPAVIEENFTRTGKLMSAQEAAEQVEKWLEDRALATKKIQAKVLPQPKGDLKRIDSAQPRQTLSNEMTASTPSYVNAPVSEADRWQRALAKLEDAAKNN